MVICIKKRGFTLIEVLVSLIILAIGLLGAATLIMHGLQTGQGASQRSVVVNAVNSFADRIRANRHNIDNYFRDGEFYAFRSGKKLNESDTGCYYDADGNSGNFVKDCEYLCDSYDSKGNCLIAPDNEYTRDVMDVANFLDDIFQSVAEPRIISERVIDNENGLIGFCILVTWRENGLGAENDLIVNKDEICGNRLREEDIGLMFMDGITSFYQTWVQL